ncbi:MAG: metallophosphoesterase [Candidatus Fischerbacteria bacterium RBG_13_37_8]|uniref:Metallophosphoesterase n=1 Tax=Candidatus Fischerbacteria bacterium RBG_13_37_8 TaxID=1817863 RepID=A0A1F5VRG0_9BACT|nr:MAG: metallophosphoesterase [Candidatus Fischerbacteria bacterium RBG_13_37_8]
MNILFIGDIIGKPARKALPDFLSEVSKAHTVDFMIANGENLAGGVGITKETAEEIFSLGINVLTTGNHIWAKKEAVALLNSEKRLLRPLNYPEQCPGNGYVVLEDSSGHKIAIINAMGRVYIQSLDCPFKAIEAVLPSLNKHTKIIIVDIHAEATSEKKALGWFLDGRVSAIVGTHTHVQTADETILPQGTAYVTDVGMVGPYDSVIGMDKKNALSRFLTQIPERLEVAKGPCIFNAVIISIDEKSGHSTSIKRILLQE